MPSAIDTGGYFFYFEKVKHRLQNRFEDSYNVVNEGKNGKAICCQMAANIHLQSMQYKKGFSA